MQGGDAAVPIGIDNLGDRDIKIRTCSFDKCSGDPGDPAHYVDCTEVLKAGSHNSTFRFDEDVKFLLFVSKGNHGPDPQGWEMVHPPPTTLAVTNDGVFIECTSDAGAFSGRSSSRGLLWARAVGHTPQARALTCHSHASDHRCFAHFQLSDCPKGSGSYCDDGAGKVPPFFCHGPTL